MQTNEAKSVFTEVWPKKTNAEVSSKRTTMMNGPYHHVHPSWEGRSGRDARCHGTGLGNARDVWRRLDQSLQRRLKVRLVAARVAQPQRMEAEGASV